MDIQERWGAPPEIQAVSRPRYPFEHSGACLVVGTAWNMWNDLERAKSLRPKHKIFGVNRTGKFLKCDLMFSFDRKPIATFRWIQQDNFGEGHFTYHSWLPDNETTYDDFPAVDYWWANAGGGGTSSWGAARVALMMGFDEVILCGVPMSPGPYVDGKEAPTFSSKQHVENSRQVMEKDTWMHEAVRSMSGWTRELLGEPV